MTKHTFLPTTNVEASQKEYLIASKFKQIYVRISLTVLCYMIYHMKSFSFIRKNIAVKKY